MNNPTNTKRIEQNTSKKLNTKLVIILLIMITAVVYAPSLKNDFVWDDYIVIVDNTFIKSWENFPTIFSKAYLTPVEVLTSGGLTGSGETTYRPVVTISYFFDYWIWKLNPFGYHFSNILLHLANVILLYLFVYLLVKNKYIALLSALIFALHPVNTEAVDVISFRKDLFVFLFLISSFILFIKHDSFRGIKKNLCIISSVSLFLLALFSKENAIMFPILLVLYDFFFIFKQKWDGFFTRVTLRYSGYILTTIFYLAVWFIFKKSMVDLIAAYPYPGGNIYTNLLTMSRVVSIYIFWLILPINIHATLPENNPALTLYTIFKPEAIFSIALIIFLLALAFIMRKKAKEISFAVFWFFIMLFPVSNIIPISCIIACRYLYVPMVGFSIAASVVLFRLYNLKSRLFPRSFLIKLVRDTIIIVLIFYSIFTAIRNLAWKNNIMLWQELVEYSPMNAVAHINLGNQLNKIGLLDRAIIEYKIAERLNPGFPEVYNLLGLTVGEEGHYEEAIKYFEKAISIDNKYLRAYDNLAVTYTRMNKYGQAKKVWEKALQINPNNSEVRKNLQKVTQLGV